MKIRKFDAGGNTRSDDPSKNQYLDPEEARYKAAGLAASNAELESGKRKPSGLLGLGRFLEGNIDDSRSEAYNKYGAGYGRKLEADRVAKSEDDPEAKFYGAGKTQSTAPAASAPAASAPAAPAASANLTKRDGREEDAAIKRVVKPFGSGPPDTRLLGNNSTTTTKVVEDMPKTRPAGGAQVATGDARVAEYANKFPSSTPPEKGDSFKKTATPAAKPPAAKPPAAAAKPPAPAAKAPAPAPAAKAPAPATETKMERRNLSVPNAAGPSAPAKAPEAAKPAEKPLSPAQQKAKDAIARATGNSSSSRVPTAAEAEQNRASFAGKAGDAVSSVGNFFRNFETPAERRSRLAKETKDKERSKFMKESGQKAGGGAIRGYASGGSVSAASRGDGIAQRGKTRGRMC